MGIGKNLLNSVHDGVIFQRRVRALSARLAEQLVGGGTVLDVGCGDGSIARGIAARRPDLTFEGVDVFRRPQTAIPVTVYDGKVIPFADRSFDWATIVDVLHHTDDPGAVLRECVRVARNGVVIKDHLRDGLAAVATLRVMDWVGNRGRDVRLPYNYLSKAQWTQLFKDIDVAPRNWRQDIGLYAFPLSLFFERGLHFIATVVNAR